MRPLFDELSLTGLKGLTQYDEGIEGTPMLRFWGVFAVSPEKFVAADLVSLGVTVTCPACRKAPSLELPLPPWAQFLFACLRSL